MSTLIWIVAVLFALGVGVFAGQRLMLARQRWSSLRNSLLTARNAQTVEGALLSTVARRDQYQRAGLNDHVKVINALQFILLWNWDLSTVLQLLRQEKQDWSIAESYRRKLIARLLALNIYETFNKLSHFFDPDWDRTWSLRRALRKIGAEAQLKSELNQAHGRVATVLETHRDLLKGIRDNVIGHRDQDVATQLTWMKKAEVKQLEQLGWELLELNTWLIGVMTKVESALKQRPARKSR